MKRIQRKRQKNFWKWLFLGISVFFMAITVSAPTVEKSPDKYRIHEIQHSEFSRELLTEYLDLKHLGYSDVAMKQFILETGHFKSVLFLGQNNIAGMKLARKRHTTAIGEHSGHAVYGHWTNSVDDYFLWVKWHVDRGVDVSDYYRFLEYSGYATNRSYTAKLKQIEL